MTGAQKCSHVHGMACEFGSGAYVWMRSAARAAFEYSRGDCNAILGDLRGAVVSCSLVCSLVGSFIGGGASIGGGRAVGVPVGVLVGGTLFRVCR